MYLYVHWFLSNKFQFRMQKIIFAFAFLFLSFAAGAASTPQTNATDPIRDQAEKVANLLESKKLEQLKKKWSKIEKKAKKSPNHRDNFGALLCIIGVNQSNQRYQRSMDIFEYSKSIYG